MMSTYTYFGRFVRILTVLLALLLLLGTALISCEKEPPVEQPDDTPGNSKPGEDTPGDAVQQFRWLLPMVG